MEDRRTVRTKKAIRDTFVELLETKDINRISVSELSDTANLGRGTFYLHYKDIYDLYEQIENEAFEHLGHFYDNMIFSMESINVVGFIELLTEYISLNHRIFKILLMPNGKLSKNDKFTDFFKQKEIEELNLFNLTDMKELEYKKLESTFLVAGVVRVLGEWIIEDRPTDTKVLVENLEKILVKFID